MQVRDAILQRLTDRMMRMRVVLEKFDDAAAEACKVGPKWNVRDLVGHFVFWDVEVRPARRDRRRKARPEV